MAFLMLLHEKMRLQRKVNKLTLRELQMSSRKERITKNIERVQKMYSSRISKVESQAKLATSQFANWSRQNAGLGMNQSINPWNFGGTGGTSTFVMQCLNQWATTGTQGVCDSSRAQQLVQGMMQGGCFTPNMDEKTGKQKEGNEAYINKLNQTCSAAEYQAIQNVYSYATYQQNFRSMQVQEMQNQHSNMVSIWEENMKAQLEAEQDAVLAPLEEQETEMDLERESCEAQLADAKARLESIKQACSEGIKDSAPTFGLG